MNSERTAYLMGIANQEVADLCERMLRTGLGGPEGPEPDKPSPRYRAPSLSQGEKK